MITQNIFTNQTKSLKTKVILSSSISLFIGLTNKLPTKVELIGLDLTSNNIYIGYFLFSITIILFVNFLCLSYFDLKIYFKNKIIKKDINNFTGNTIGLTLFEIDDEFSKRDKYEENYDSGDLSSEYKDIKLKIEALEEKYDKKCLTGYNNLEICFNFLLPSLLSIIGILYLYIFLFSSKI